MKENVSKIAWLIVILGVALVLFFTPAPPRDSTDPPDGRSGLRLYTDHGTGCQYIAPLFGDLLPRLDAEGNHICGGEP